MKQLAIEIVSLILYFAPYAFDIFVAWWLMDFRTHVIDIRGQIRRNADLFSDLSRGVSALIGLPSPEDLRRFTPPPPADEQEGQVYMPRRED